MAETATNAAHDFLLELLDKNGDAVQWKSWRRKNGGARLDLKKVDLKNRDVSGFDFSKADLSGANFFNANLNGADLSHARLMFADLSRADIAGAYFNEANLSGATVKGVNGVDTSFQNATLRGAKMRGAYLTGANFTGADLTNADLRGANLKYADLTDALTGKANVEDADLRHCRLEEEQREAFECLDKALYDKPRDKNSIQVEDAHDDLFSEEDASKILEIAPGSDLDAIARAYKQRVMEYHPDRVAHLGRKLQIVASREFERIQEAYRSLSRHRSKPQVQIANSAPGTPRKPAAHYTMQELKALAKSQPKNDAIFYNLGLKYFEHGKIDKAIKAYEWAIKLNPKNRFAEHNLRVAQLSLTLLSAKAV